MKYYETSWCFDTGKSDICKFMILYKNFFFNKFNLNLTKY